MNKKWKWVLEVVKVIIVLLVPLTAWNLLMPQGRLDFRIVFLAWLVMIALVLFILFGMSEEG